MAHQRTRRCQTAMPQEKQPEPPPASGDAMTIHDLAKYLGVSWRTIQEWEGQKIAPPRMPLPGRVRRWSPAEVDQWLRERRAAENAMAGGPESESAV